MKSQIPSWKGSFCFLRESTPSLYPANHWTVQHISVEWIASLAGDCMNRNCLTHHGGDLEHLEHLEHLDLDDHDHLEHPNHLDDPDAHDQDTNCKRAGRRRSRRSPHEPEMTWHDLDRHNDLDDHDQEEVAGGGGEGGGGDRMNPQLPDTGATSQPWQKHWDIPRRYRTRHIPEPGPFTKSPIKPILHDTISALQQKLSTCFTCFCSGCDLQGYMGCLAK